MRGWVEGSGTDLVELGRRFEASGVAALDRHRDRDATARSRGPTSSSSATVLASVELPVVASGGVGTLDDLRALDALEVDGRRLVGAIVGRALYEERFTVAEGLAVLRP